MTFGVLLRYGPSRKMLELRVLPRRNQCVQVWVIEEFGRRLYRRQILSSDAKWTLMDGRPRKKLDMMLHNFGQRPEGGAHLAPLARGEVVAASPAFKIYRPSVVIKRESDGAYHLPEHLLEGLLPAALIQNFQLWSRPDGLEGVAKKGSKMRFSLYVDLQPPVLKVDALWLGAAVWRMPPAGEAAEPLMLLDLLERPRQGSLLWRVASVVARIESLSHALAWGRPDEGLTLLELPRIGTSFEPRPGPHGEAWLFNCDLQELALAEEVPEAVMSLCRGLPHSLVLRDREGSFHVMVVNSPLLRRRAKQQPLYNFSVPNNDSPRWAHLFRSRYFLCV